MRILILDDDPAIREIYRDMFRLNEHLVHEESNGADGLLTLGQFTFNLVVTDITMPILDGIQFLKVARPRYPFLPIVIITGGTHYDNEDIMAYGASGIIEKTSMNCEMIQNLAIEWTRAAVNY
jgi:DNA-binding NtrC family response regulator